jgi:hypothetical protein
MSSEISNEQLVAYCLGELNAADQAAVSAFSESSPAAGARIDRIRQMIGTLRTGLFAPVPAATRARAINLWEAHQVPSLIERLQTAVQTTMTLMFDSLRPGTLAGFRGSADGRHLSYQFDDIEVDLLVDATADGMEIQGQILGANGSHAIACEVDSSTPVAQSSANESGAFHLKVAGPGCDVVIMTDSHVLRLGQVCPA